MEYEKVEYSRTLMTYKEQTKVLDNSLGAYK